MIIIRTLFDLFETSPERIFGYLLEIDIDCRVNAKAFVFRPVPSDGGNNLLPNAIDRVALTLRVLSAANDDLFGPRSGASFATDQVKIAHAIERVIAHLA